MKFLLIRVNLIFISLLMFAYPVMSVAVITDAVGTVDGEFSVSQTSGAATYKIPIKTPPGIGGLQPELALVYNSGGGNGILGQGWSLAGLSAITRCPRNFAQDGETRGIKNDNFDRLCMDGERMVSTSKFEAFGGASTFRLESNNPGLISAEAQDFFSGEINSFKMKTRSGLTKIYKETRRYNSWAIGSIIDDYNNQIVYNYLPIDHSNTTVTDPKIANSVLDVNKEGILTGTVGEKLVKEVQLGSIQYNVNGVNILPVSKEIHVCFAYVDRGSNGSNTLRTLSSNIEERNTVLLKSITISNGGCFPDDQNLIKRYVMEYDATLAGPGHTYRLDSIKECGLDTNKVLKCVPPTVFGYQGGNIIAHEQTNALSIPAANKTDLARIRSGDFNGDGITDMYRVEGANNAETPDSIYLGTTSGSFGSRIEGPPTFVNEVGSHLADISRVKIGDFNGDGLSDIYHVNGSYSNDVDTIFFSKKREGISFFPSGPLEAYSATATNIDSFVSKKKVDVEVDTSRYVIADFNGDAKDDVYWIGLAHGQSTKSCDYDAEGTLISCYDNFTTVDRLFLSNGDGTFNEVSGLNISYYDHESNNPTDMRRLKFADFNGDGMTDIYVVNGFNGTAVDKVYISQGKYGFARSDIDPNPESYNGLNSEVKNCTTCEAVDIARIKPADFNGDGKSDLYVVNGWGGEERDKIYLYNGNGKFSSTIYEGLNSYIPGLLEKSTTYAQSAAVSLAAISGIQFADFNGDGVIDIHNIQKQRDPYDLFQIKQEYSIYTGSSDKTSINELTLTGSTSSVIAYRTADGSIIKEHSQLLDTYILYASDVSTSIISSSIQSPESSSITKIVYKLDSQFTDLLNDANSRYVFGDYNGDRGADVYHYPYSQTVNQLAKSQTNNILLNEVTNGLGDRASITYKPISDSSVYSSQDSCSYPIRCLQTGFNVVSMQTTNDGLGGVNIIHYDYYDYRHHLRGRGSLGFSQVDTLDQNTGIVTTNFYNKSSVGVNLYAGNDSSNADDVVDTYPFVGMPNYSMTLTSKGGEPSTREIVKSVYSQYKTKKFKEILGSNEKTTFMVYNARQTNLDYDNGYINRQEISQTQIDKYGNIILKSTAIESTPYEGGEPDYHTTIIDNEYYYDQFTDLEEITLRNGRLETATVTTSTLKSIYDDYVIGGALLTAFQSAYAELNPLEENNDSRMVNGRLAQRHTKYTYKSIGHVRNAGHLISTEEEDNRAENSENLITVYTYDVYGNRESSTVSGDNIVTRVTNTEYEYLTTADNTYTIKTTNALGTIGNQTSTQTIDIRWGKPEKVYDINGIEKTFQYDAFGRTIKETSAHISETHKEYHWCKNYADCPTLGKYLIKTYSHVQNQPGRKLSPPTIVYYDTLGRKIRTETVGFASPSPKTIIKDIHYDSQGRVWRESQPYFSNVGAELWTVNYFDDRGRVTKSEQADGSTMTQYYDGNLTTSTRERVSDAEFTTVQTTQILNAQGKVAKAQDELGNFTLYEYFPFGELKAVYPESEVDNESAQIRMTYDKRGRKLTMDDPDMGHWEYQYDALGNLRNQKDANGNIVDLEYDLLNRLVKRTETQIIAGVTDVETSVWCYDQLPTLDASLCSESHAEFNFGKTKGKLLKVKNLKDGYEEITTYDPVLGRPLKNIRSFKDQQTNVVSYETETVYNAENGRVDSVIYPESTTANAAKIRFTKVNHYDEYGFLVKVFDAANMATPIWEAIDANKYGNISKEKLGNNITTLRGFNSATGMIETISSGIGSSSNVQNLVYHFDTLGNLRSRYNYNLALAPNTPELFEYDGINRLARVTKGNNTTHQYLYDIKGNLIFNSELGYYNYGETINNVPNGPHRVTSINRINKATNSAWTKGDVNTDGNINSMDVELSAKHILQTGKQYPSTAECDGQAGITVHDVACIATFIGSTGGTDQFEYDENGNMTLGLGSSVNYSSFNKPTRIIQGGNELTFNYSPSRSRYKQNIKGINAGEVHYVGKLFERVEEDSGKISFKNYINAGGRLIAVKTFVVNATTPTVVYSNNTRYMHRDHIGSIDVISNESGAVVARYDYDAFGKLRTDVFYTDTSSTTNFISAASRGYTGHEHLSTVGLIHMNGRVYNPLLGRFLSADPHIQFAHDSQSYNRYSYVLNNPLSFTDPSGYFLNKIWDAGSSFLSKHGRTIAAVAITAFVPNPFVGGFMAGYVSSNGNLDAALIGGMTGVMFSGLHGMGPSVSKVFAHGIVGGASSVMNGGSFGSGFMSTAFTQSFSWAAGDDVFGGNTANPMVRVKNAFAAAIIGGTGSVIGGGKFSNGAVSGAFSRMFNDLKNLKHYNVNLLEHEFAGGHTIKYHVSKKISYLFGRARSKGFGKGQDLDKIQASSFRSLREATNLINIVLRENDADIQQMLSTPGHVRAYIETTFDKPTGYSVSRMKGGVRQPYSVFMVLQRTPDTNTSDGFVIITAFPR